jgi:hypothetical protein
VLKVVRMLILILIHLKKLLVTSKVMKKVAKISAMKKVMKILKATKISVMKKVATTLREIRKILTVRNLARISMEKVKKALMKLRLIIKSMMLYKFSVRLMLNVLLTCLILLLN